MPLSPWVTPGDLPAGLPALPGGEDELAAVCGYATTVLYGLSGRRWAGRQSRTIQVFASGTPWWWQRVDLGLTYDTSWGVCGMLVPPYPLLIGGELYNHARCDRPPVIRLPDFPVRGITEVRVAGQVRDPDSYRLMGRRFLEDSWLGWQVCGLDWGEVMTVAYDHGAEPPAAATLAATRLASELVKANAGQPSALPGYVTQRVRQGLTESFTSAAALFDKGRTGVPDVDLWLATVNPSGLRRRSRTWSPDTDPNYRTTTGGTTP